MLGSAAARRYARALFSLAQDSGTIAAIRGELDAMAKLVEESPELSQALFRPLHPVAERRALLRAVSQRLGASDTLQRFFCVLVDHRRLVDFDAVYTEYGRLADLAAGRTEAEVVSASPLRDEQRERLRRALAGRIGREVELVERVDPALLGGAIASVEGVVFDGSLRTQLAQLRASLTRGH